MNAAAKTASMRVPGSQHVAAHDYCTCPEATPQQIASHAPGLVFERAEDDRYYYMTDAKCPYHGASTHARLRQMDAQLRQMQQQVQNLLELNP